jgi:hypothetical protein
VYRINLHWRAPLEPELDQPAIQRERGSEHMAVVESAETVEGQEVEIRIDVDEPVGADLAEVYGDTRFGRRTVARTENLFASGLAVVRSCAARTVEGISEMEEAHRPDEFEVELAIKLDAELGAHLVKLISEAQIRVTMTWRRDS